MVKNDRGPRWVLPLVLTLAFIVLVPVLWMIGMMLVGGGMMDRGGGMMGGMLRSGLLWTVLLAGLIGAMIAYLIQSLRSR